MKRLEIVLLLAAGAVAGALVMKVALRPARLAVPSPAAAAVVAQAPAAALPNGRGSDVLSEPRPSGSDGQTQQRPSPFSPPLAGNPEPVAAPPAPPTPPAPPEPENATPPPPTPPAPEPHKVMLNAGMLLPVRLVDGLSSERNAPGDAFLATLDKELVVDGFVIAERGARVEGRVVASDPGGKMQRAAAIAVELTRLHTSDGQNVAIRTDSFERHAEQARADDVEKVAAGAVIGATVGAMAGGGKGAAIGAGVGGGAGAGDVLLTRAKPATLPSETRISFRLRAPLTLTEQL